MLLFFREIIPLCRSPGPVRVEEAGQVQGVEIGDCSAAHQQEEHEPLAKRGGRDLPGQEKGREHA